MPGSDRLRIWRFWKRRQLGLGCGPVELVVHWRPVQLVVEWGRVELGVYWRPVQLVVEWGPGRVGSWLGLCRKSKLSYDHGVEKLKSDPGVVRISTDRDLKHYGMRCAFVGSDQAIGSFVGIDGLRIVSLSPRVEETNSEVKKLINVRSWTTVSSPVNVPVYLSIWICTCAVGLRYHYDYDMIMKWLYNTSSSQRWVK